jgi:predicted DNA-binding transcriptional regulator YafY
MRRDGSVILSITVTHLLEVKRLALSFGADCTVLALPGLRKLVKDEAEAMAKLYEVAEQ